MGHIDENYVGASRRPSLVALPGSRGACDPPPGAQQIAVTYRSSSGAIVRSSLDRVPVEEIVDGLPVREFRWYKGRRHCSGFPAGPWSVADCCSR